MIIDLHVHTTEGSRDSALTIHKLVEEAESIGLDGVCLTEHACVLAADKVERFASNSHIVLIRGMEVETDAGHIVVFGLDRYVSGIHKIKELRRVADEAGGLLIAVHPFRRYPDLEAMGPLRWQRWPLVLEEALALKSLSLVDEIEVLNAACDEPENLLALEVAKRLGFRGTAGSDAHSTQGLGRYVTVFERQIGSEQELIAELKAGRFYPAKRLPSGEFIPFVNNTPP